MLRFPAILLLLSQISTVVAQASPDGSIVPFTSGLPICASKCGPLFDVQGKCSPPVTAEIDKDCFCLDSRLKPFKAGLEGVSSICGSESCTSDAELRGIRSWYFNYCGSPSIAVDGGPGSISDGNSSENESWISGHYKWVIMLVAIFTIIFGAWILACIFRKRYNDMKETEIETAVPVAWGPHQMQGATGGYSNHVNMVEKIYSTPNISKPTALPAETVTDTDNMIVVNNSTDTITPKEESKLSN